MPYTSSLELFSHTDDSPISLLRYTKSACGVDFMLNTAESSEKPLWLEPQRGYKTDFFAFFFFRKAQGFVLLNGQRIDLHDEQLLIISPYEQQEWHVVPNTLDYTFLVFQEAFMSHFLSDAYFMYRLLYCYQSDQPRSFAMALAEMQPFIATLHSIKAELHAPVADSYHMIVAHLYHFLLSLNRHYARLFHLPIALPLNNYAYQYKQLLEHHIRHKVRVEDYATLIGISRVSLNKAVTEQFGVSASHLLKQRLLQEVKHELLFSDQSIKEVAHRLHFSEPQHMMRFFKKQTGQTITAFLDEYTQAKHTAR